ncbi:MAG: iron-sulfur cluster assembly scaffold protein [Planctomycetota bacterium]|nr:iron-sulfur cluster assembly scaffold protein [Planctomycetota bacterium]
MNPGFRDHFENPRGLGTLENPSAAAKHVNPACGDILQFSVLVTDGVIADLRFQCKGCSASIAAASALVTCAKGQAVQDAEKIDLPQLEELIGELPVLSKHGFTLALDAFKSLLAEL